MSNTNKTISSSKSNNNQSLNPQAQWHQQGPPSSQQQQSQQQQQQLSQSTTEPYTLPGVINYLTSEFTNLERYKIMTNLEKSEMKYKIVQLQGEVNSLKFANNKQKARIEALEEENRRLKGKTGDEETGNGSSEEFIIPEVDLSIIKNSRQQLTKSMREIVNLLKTPSSKNINYLNFPDPNESLNNEFDVLINNSVQQQQEEEEEDSNNVESLLFKELSGEKSRLAPNSIISQFFNDNKSEPDTNLDVKIPSPKFDDDNDMIYNDGLERVITQDSEATTMIMGQEDDDEEEHIHANDVQDDIPGVISPFPSPEPEISDFNDLSYEILDVYDGNNITIYLNSMSDNKQIKLTAVRKSDNKISLSKQFELDLPLNNISNIFPISIDEEIFLIVDKQGEIKYLQVRETPKATTLSKSTFQTVQSNDLIEFTSKATETSKSFGLAITGTSTNGFLVKVYQITYTKGKLTSKEIGSYNKKFLTKGKNSEVSFIGWYVNDKPKLLTPDHSKTKSKNNVSCDDVELAPYELLYKVEEKTIQLNIVSKQSSYLN